MPHAPFTKEELEILDRETHLPGFDTPPESARWWERHLHQLRQDSDPIAPLVAAQLRANVPPFPGNAPSIQDPSWLPGAEAELIDLLTNSGIYSIEQLSRWDRRSLAALDGLDSKRAKRLVELVREHGPGPRPNAAAGKKLFAAARREYGWKDFVKKHKLNTGTLRWRCGYLFALSLGIEQISLLEHPLCRYVRSLHLTLTGWKGVNKLADYQPPLLSLWIHNISLLSVDIAEIAKDWPSLRSLRLTHEGLCQTEPVHMPRLEELAVSSVQLLQESTVSAICASHMPALRNLEIFGIGRSSAALVLSRFATWPELNLKLSGAIEPSVRQALEAAFGERVWFGDTDRECRRNSRFDYPELEAEPAPLTREELVGSWRLDEVRVFSEHTPSEPSQWQEISLDLDEDGRYRLALPGGEESGQWSFDVPQIRLTDEDVASIRLHSVHHRNGQLLLHFEELEHAIEVFAALRRV